MLAVNTAIFTAVSTARIELAGIEGRAPLDPAQRAAALDIVSGARNLHALPFHTINDVPDFADLVAAAYQSGLQTVLWISAALVIAVLLMVLRWVPRRLVAVE
jgi:hypothetical protein